MKNLIKIYWFATLSTALIWLAVGWKLGLAAFFTVFVLTLLEVTFSADNAVVNSKVLNGLSKFWQTLFLTVGIILAVFVVRFIMPIFIVMMTAGLGFNAVVQLALNDPVAYGHALEHAAPFINAFGGTFLLMITLGFFLDYEKEHHWLSFLERRLGRLGQFQNITTFIMLVATLLLYITVDPTYHSTVFVSAIFAMALHIGLGLLDAIITRKQGSAAPTTASTSTAPALKTGVAGFAAFMYLQILDASFSLDGVIGAFAITDSVILIMAGLGAGAVWVRSMTVHLVRSGALAKYVYLEHGAHWAIGFLGAVMIAKLYGIEPPEWFTGSIGLIFAGAAVWWSKRALANK